MVILGLLALLAGGAAAAPAPLEGLQPYLVGIGVADTAASASWYRTCLGFEVYQRMDLPERGLKIVFLRTGSFRLELVEKVGALPLRHFAPGLTDDMLVLGLKKVAFLVPDVDEAAARLKAQKVRFVVEPFVDKPMKLRSFIVADPDGNLLQFMQEVR